MKNIKSNKVTIDYNSNVNQNIKQKFVNQEVIYCVSTLVRELAKKAEEFPDYTEDLYGAFEGIPDYEEAARHEGWEEGNNEKDKYSYYNEELGEASFVDTWRELCEEQNIGIEEYTPEIYEHWIVTDFLANKLEEQGGKVLRDFFGMTVWCRPTTGQAILLDHVISEICADMEILEGQNNDWSK